MGLFSKLVALPRRIYRGLAADLRGQQGDRRCRLESLEPRCLLAGDIQIGAVYYEDASGFDEQADTIRITWSGGQPGTQLTQLSIETDKVGDGLTIGDVFFDTSSSGLGAYGASPLVIQASNGFTVNSVNVSDGGTVLTFTFSGFDAGEQLIFTVDVDEQGFLGPNAVAEGNEFEGSRLLATFQAPHFYSASGQDIFIDQFQSKWQAAGLNLPNDNYAPIEESASPVRTAGAFFPLTQVPLPSSLSGVVFEDANQDNVRQAGETRLSGVTVQLWKLDNGSYVNTGLTAQTSAQGAYKFENLLPGSYRVVEVQPGGYFSVGSIPGQVNGATVGVSTTADILSDIVLLGGEDSVNNDFGEVRPASIAGRVHADRDGDCLFDSGEPLLAGVTIELLNANGQVLQTTLTNAQGQYLFSNLAPGVYGVREVQPPAYLDFGEMAGTAGGVVSNDLITQVSLGSGVNATGYDFCEIEPARLTGRVHVDRDGDCMYDEGEPTLEGVTIELLDADQNVVATTTTDAQGLYAFEMLSPGVYSVRQQQPSGYFSLGAMAGTEGGTVTDSNLISNVNLAPAANALDYDFCEVEPASVSGYVHADRDGDCVIDPEEPMLSGVVMQLFDANGVLVATTTTNTQGYYEFTDLMPGTYSIVEQQPAGYFDSEEEVGSAGGVINVNDRIDQIPLGPNVQAVNYNFCEVEPASISGQIHVDRDGDCELDQGEPTLEGVVVELLDENGNVLQSTLTDSNGEYEFSGLAPGVYSVREQQPAGYFSLGEDVGTAGGVINESNRIDLIVLHPAQAGLHYDFCEIEPAAIHGRVHVDLNGDCIQNEGEPSIADVEIQLLDGNGNLLAITHTNAAGEYAFDGLMPGTYRVREIQPAGYFDGGDSIGTLGGEVLDNDLLGGIVLAPGAIGLEYNFCETPGAKLSGYVFVDGGPLNLANTNDLSSVLANLRGQRDGQRTSDDTPLAGVRLRLADGAGATLLDGFGNPIETVTNAQGYYEFNNLPPGLYTVYQVQPGGYFDGIDTAGSTGGLALNADLKLPAPNSNGGGLIFVATDAGTLVLTEQDLQVLTNIRAQGNNDVIARISLEAGQNSVENNFSEVFVQQRPFYYNPPPPSTPPTVTTQNLGLIPPPVIIMPPAQTNTPAPVIQGSGGLIVGGRNYTWHLSVINAGQPRWAAAGEEEFHYLASTRYEAQAWMKEPLAGSTWQLQRMHNKILGQRVERLFGRRGSIPVTGDFNGDGITEIGIFYQGYWFLDANGNGVWDEGDLWAHLGKPGDRPVTGDWDGDGKDDIGIYGPAWPGDPRAIAAEPGLPDPLNQPTGRYKNVPPRPEDATNGVRELKQTAQGRVRADLIDHVFEYGDEQDVPVSGDWDGDGVDTIGLFHNGQWILDVDGDGRWSREDAEALVGEPGDLPVVGDFDGDGYDELGVYRGGKWLIDSDRNYRLDENDQSFQLGGPHDRPVVGDWDADGVDEPGLYQGEDVPADYPANESL